jgi:hypothetical protein
VQGADENSTAVVQIVIGTYSDTDDGWLDVSLIIDAIRADLGAAPAIDGTAFEHVGRCPGTSPSSSRARSGSAPSQRIGKFRVRHESRRATHRRAEAWVTAFL